MHAYPLGQIAISLKEIAASLKALTDLYIGDQTQKAAVREKFARRKYNNPSSREVATYAKRALIEVGVPMRAIPLYDLLVEKGLVITSIDPVKLMSTSLTREGEIICQVPNRGYWVTGMDVPPLEGEELAAFEKKYQRALKRKRA